jgi:hypothetical protein
MHNVLKKHYKPVSLDGDRPLLQHMLLACCLENAPYDRAEKAFKNLIDSFFDLNEVRVSTVKELAESLRDLPDPSAAASNLKRVLQTVFESTYSFDLEMVKKQNIGVGIKRLSKMEGASPFVVAYATQHGLGGHFIPLDRGALEVLYIVGIATEAERDSGAVAGLERAIPKNKGVVFSSLLHQLAAEIVANPFSPNVKNLLLSINPDAKNRLPKRGQKKLLEIKPAAKPMHGDKGAKGAADAKPHGGKHGEKAAPEPVERNGSQKGAAHDRKSASQKPGAEPAKKKLAAAKVPLAKPTGKGQKPVHHVLAGAGKSGSRKSASRHLTKRKPR